MRQVFPTSGAALILVAMAVHVPANAEPIRGQVVRASVTSSFENLGYVRTQVARSSPILDNQQVDVSLFLKVVNSVPIPAPTKHLAIRINGLRLVPDVAACAVDAQVVFYNDGPTPVTLEIGGTTVTVAPRDSAAYECTAGERGGDERRSVRVREWPHIRGVIFVGEVGVVAAPDETGSFTLDAPKGQYELLVVNRDGVVARQEVEVKERRPVDVGTIDLASVEASNGASAADPQ